jgi:CMP-N-acetylneuraminic acid synthetase
MRKVAMVPVKLNNQRFQGKNVKTFWDEKPLITYFLEQLLGIEGLKDIYLFCSNPDIQAYMPQGIRFLKRPTYLDTAQATPQDIIREFMKVVDADVYMVSHCTSPFVTKEHFEACFRAVEEQGYDSAFTGEKIQRLMWKSDGTPFNFQPDAIPRTQDLEVYYNEVSAAYVFRKETFLTLQRRVGVNPYIVEVKGVECIDIDYSEDFEIADAIYRYLLQKEGK